MIELELGYDKTKYKGGGGMENGQGRERKRERDIEEAKDLEDLQI